MNTQQTVDIIQRHTVIGWLCRPVYQDHSSQKCRLGLYSKSAEHDDACQPLTLFMCVLIHHPHLAHHTDSADSTADPPAVPSASKPPPTPNTSLYETVPNKCALWRHSLPKSIGQQIAQMFLPLYQNYPCHGVCDCASDGVTFSQTKTENTTIHILE